ncbi:MAG: putative transporter, rane protein [Verrucomicrobiales bacterium]|nr:putative transporter, rane protein [Verrucomicrobiales bacterium]
MKRKQFETLLYSTIGVVLLFALVLAINFIATRARYRVDLTQEKAYTFSDGTKAIIGRLDTPVKIRFYCTQGESSASEAVFLKNYAHHVEDLLAEYKQVGKGKIIIEKYDPQPDSDAEDSARLDNVEGQMLSNGEKFYLGLSVNMLDQRETVPFLSPTREKLMEYDVTRAIARVQTTEKPVIGVMSSMVVFGQQQSPMMARMGQQASDPWVFISELKRDFNVKKIEMEADKIDDDVKVLVLIHPKGITAQTEYAIDQFVMRGGKLLAFIDPNCYFDPNRQERQMGGGFSSSNLEKLFKSWGLQFDPAKVIGDLNYPTRIQEGNIPTVLTLTADAVNKNDPVTGQIDNMLFPFSGAFAGTPAAGLTQTVLIKSSTKADLVDTYMAQLSGVNVANDIKPTGKEFSLAVRLSGKFKTAFPEGKPKAKAAKPEDKDKKEEPAEAGLKESKDTSVILVADSDMLTDEGAQVEKQNFFGQKVIMMHNGNLPFVQNCVEQLSGDNNLIGVRSRATLNRPFKLVKDMELAAQEKFQGRIKEMEKTLQEAQQKVNDLQRNKSKEQRFILSPEQQKEIESVRKKEAETNKELKKLRKELRQEVDSLENRLKWMNILSMPILVAISGLTLAVVKRKRTAAK